MALQFIDKKSVGAIVVDAWQKQLNTEKDPANGQWFTNDPSNGGGLYGQLTDALATELVFLEDRKVFRPSQVAATKGRADNRNGLTPEQTVTLTYQWSDSNSTTQSSTNGLKIGIGIDIKAKATFLGAGGEVTTKLSTEYTYSWTKSTTTTQTETKTFQQVIPVRAIPKGRIYEVVLMCNKDQLEVPYQANIYLTGHTTATFNGPVNGKDQWTVDAGTLCEWIATFGSAGDQSPNFKRDPADPTRGIISYAGTMTATQTANFLANTVDVTDSFMGTADPLSQAAVVSSLVLT
jgi:hypothetical protein